MANIKKYQAYLMNRGMLGAGELRITFHNYSTHWEDKLERPFILARKANLCPR